MAITGGTVIWKPAAYDTMGYRARIFENRQRLDFNDQLPEHESRWERTGKILQRPTTL